MEAFNFVDLEAAGGDVAGFGSWFLGDIFRGTEVKVCSICPGIPTTLQPLF